MSSPEHLVKELIDEYYKLALLDISKGVSVDELERIVKIYEEDEVYEACAGILKAIEESNFLTLKEIKLIIKDGNRND